MTHRVFVECMAAIFAAFRSHEPQGDPARTRAILGLWFRMLEDLTDHEMQAATMRLVTETRKIYPGDNLVAMIRSIARPPPDDRVTVGDCIELIEAAVSRFGRYREAEALSWIGARSRLARAAISRFGFRRVCDSEEPDVVRGQLRVIFEAEKRRAAETGAIYEGAEQACLAAAPPRQMLKGGGVLHG